MFNLCLKYPDRATAFFFLLLTSAGVGMAGCNSTTASTPPAPNSPDTFLIPGNTAQYNGTESVVITFATPSSTTPNSTVNYVTAESDTVQTSPANAPAPLDLHRVITYTPSAAPQYGNNLATNTTDQYENIVATNSGTFDIVIAQTISAQSGTNISDADTAPSGAPYAYTSTTTTTYTVPTIVNILPLTAGAQWSSSLARTVSAVSNTTNATGAPYAASNLTTVYQSDDSYSETGQNSLTSTTVRSEATNGTGTITNTAISTGTVSLQETIGVPTLSGSDYVIPVSTTTTGSPVNDDAADWYPGAALPPSPLGTVAFTVVGTTNTLPTGCTYTGTQPNVVEFDSTTSVLDVVAGTVTTGTSRTFDSNGLTVCRLSVSTVKNYSLTTGLLTRTTITTTDSSLNNS